MAQTPVSLRVTLPGKQNFIGGSGFVQVLQTQARSDAQNVEQRPQNMKTITTIRPFVPAVSGMTINTNTAVQYVRNTAEIPVFGAPGAFVACFAQGQLCQNCNCHNCMNNLAYEEERRRAIRMTLERNPTAFHPKIGRGKGERKHTKGCNCKRSGCLKNYCECYEAKISCSDLCRCQGCCNTEDSVERRSLMRLSAIGVLRSRQPSSFKKHLLKPVSEMLSHVFFTWEVIEATATCIMAQA
ncbi:unnamed protein product, partial [Trichobilharzia regenti]